MLRARGKGSKYIMPCRRLRRRARRCFCPAGVCWHAAHARLWTLLHGRQWTMRGSGSQAISPPQERAAGGQATMDFSPKATQAHAVAVAPCSAITRSWPRETGRAHILSSQSQLVASPSCPPKACRGWRCSSPWAWSPSVLGYCSGRGSVMRARPCLIMCCSFFLVERLIGSSVRN